VDCQQAQETILEWLIEPLDEEQTMALERHLASCEICRSFAETQRKLDARLAEAFSGADLSPAFRTRLKARIGRDPVSSWPDFLPDLAHVGGCVAATLVLVFVLPLYSGTVILASCAFTALTFFLQAVLRGFLDSLE
jgi:anti-sigma factor RsiW